MSFKIDYFLAASITESFVHLCVYMLMCVQICVHVYAHKCGSQRLGCHALPPTPLHLTFGNKISHWAWRLCHARRAGQPALRIFLPPFLRCYHIWPSNVGDGESKLTQPCLHGKYLTDSFILYGSTDFSHTYPSLRSTCIANVLKNEQMEQFTNGADIIKKL